MFHTILTHESPDLDAIMSVLLMRKFGEEKFPGVSTAKIEFASAGKLPDGKSTDELEKEGILCLDIGGGRFDTHPVGTQMDQNKRERSASDLVGEELGLIYDENWAPLIEYTRLQDTQGYSLSSKEYIHHLVSIHTMLLGLDIMYNGDSEGKLQAGMNILENIPVYVENKAKNFNFKELLTQLIDRYTLESEADPEIPTNAYDNFNKWYQRLQLKPKEAFATEELDDMVSLKAIAIGAFYNNAKDRDKVFEVVSLCLKAIFTREEQWALALKEFAEKAVSKRINSAMVTYITSENGMVIKASRYKGKGDLIIYRDPATGATSILRRQKGPLERFPLRELAAKVRLAECTEQEEEVNYESLEAEGTVHGWFLHQSGNLLIKGSPKATDFVPSKIPIDLIAKIAYYQLSDNFPFPTKYGLAYMGYQRWMLQQKFKK